MLILQFVLAPSCLNCLASLMLILLFVLVPLTSKFLFYWEKFLILRLKPFTVIGLTYVNLQNIFFNIYYS